MSNIYRRPSMDASYQVFSGELWVFPAEREKKNLHETKIRLLLFWT
jgi:hypothetical protein